MVAIIAGSSIPNHILMFSRANAIGSRKAIRGMHKSQSVFIGQNLLMEGGKTDKRVMGRICRVKSEFPVRTGGESKLLLLRPATDRIDASIAKW